MNKLSKRFIATIMRHYDLFSLISFLETCRPGNIIVSIPVIILGTVRGMGGKKVKGKIVRTTARRHLS